MGNQLRVLFETRTKDKLTNVPESFFDVKAEDDDGNIVDFEDYKKAGRAYLIINTACL